MINNAIITATQAHKGQVRKGTDIPYILHPLEAGTIALSVLTQLNRTDLDVISASILHDTIEDTQLDRKYLETHFNLRIVELVVSQSEDKSKSWDERKQHTIDYLSETSDIDVKIVHLADKLSNIRAIHRDFNMCGELLWERFNATKDKQFWYYSSLVYALDELKETDAHIEFKHLVHEIFIA